MLDELKIPWDEAQSEAWWERAAAGLLSPAETRIWQAYLASCDPCRREWEALTSVERILRTAPAPPRVADDFTQATLARWQQSAARATVSRWIGILFLTLIIVVELAWLGHTAFSARHLLDVLFAGRQVWWEALTLMWSSFLVSWQALLPVALTIALLAFLWYMPNGLLVTAGLLFWTHHRAGTR